MKKILPMMLIADLISMQRRNVNQYAGGKNEESSTGRWGRG